MAGFAVANRGIAAGSDAVGSAFRAPNSPYVVANGRTDTAVSAAIGSLPTVPHPTLGNTQWGTVVLPPGTYTFSNTINLPSYVHIDGLKRAIVTRAGGFNGALFSAAGAITDFALNGIVWDNNATANFMVQLPNGISSFQMLWARFQNTNGSPFQINGGVGLSTDITAEDIRLYAVGSPVNTNGLEFYDCANLSIKGIKSLIQSGTSALSALNVQALGAAPTLYNINVEDVEVDTPNATAIFLRNNTNGVIDGASFKGIRGQGIGSVTIPKGLLDVGEQVTGTAGQSITRNVHVEDVEGKDWWGALVSIGTAQSGGGNVYDFSVTDVRGDGQQVSGGVDTSRTSSVLNVSGAQYGTIEGIIARNTGNGGMRFITTTFQSPAYIRCTNIDVESCVQNTTSGWHETGIFMDSGTHDITFVNPRSANNYSAANPGGASVGAGIGCAATSSSTQCNDITIISPVCTDTRAGGSQFQDVGIRIGETDPDAWQPNRWTIIGGNLSGNGVAPIYGIPGTAQQYSTTDHGHRLVATRNTGLNDFVNVAANNRDSLANLSRNVLAESIPMTSAQGTSILASGELTGCLIGLLAGDVVKGIAFNLVVSAATPTLFKVALYDTAGNLLASSVDQSGTINSTSFKSIAFSSSYTVAANGGFYAAVLAVYTGTSMSVDRGRTSSAMTVTINSGKTPLVKQTGLADLSSPATFATGNNASAAYHLVAYK